MLAADQTLLMDGNTIHPPRLIALYLPQFYPTHYNDEWWGKGFTEWTNVVKASPRFKGHYQPHLPADLGFYDLRLPEAREAQADLARAFGIHGFCYYHYWFSGRRVLERPLDDVLALGKPDFPFCVCWANENWTRTWDGRNGDVLIPQQYSAEDDLAHIRHLLPILEDPRYIRVEGKSLLLVYRVELLPQPQKTAERWRAEACKAGLGEIFLVNVESNAIRVPLDPRILGFDASVRFQPSAFSFHYSKFERRSQRLKNIGSKDAVYPYRDLHRFWAADPPAPYRRFDCVTPMWDNSARRRQGAFILRDSTPADYEAWLRHVIQRAQPDSRGEKWVFINAWNEWGEGCHLEPCQKWGRAYLEATKRAVGKSSSVYGAK
jgi:lipopolysaccharide biosynthesis protein